MVEADSVSLDASWRESAADFASPRLGDCLSLPTASPDDGVAVASVFARFRASLATSETAYHWERRARRPGDEPKRAFRKLREALDDAQKFLVAAAPTEDAAAATLASLALRA